jgi:AcrR family transcriptional regulator
MQESAPTIPTRRPGRPRSITLDAVIDAACDLGPDRVEMTSVAERLGVGVATLYRYVRDRDHLMRLVAARRTRNEGIPDRGQSWQDALREHAALVFEMYRSWPQLIGHVTSGAIDEEAETINVERVITILIDRGFAPADALNLYYEIHTVVVGAAVGWASTQAIEARLGGYEAMVSYARAARGPDSLPMLRLALEAGGPPTAIGDYRTPLERLIAAHEKVRRP